MAYSTNDVEVAVVVEHAGVDELVLELLARAARVGRDQIVVREGRLRVLVEPLHVRVGRRGVEIEVVLLDVLAVVPFGVAQAEEPLLQDRILAVPERQRETQPLLQVGEAGEPVLAPVIRARPRLVVREVLPRVAVRAVVLAHGAPLPLAEVRPPPPPGRVPLAPGLQPCELRGRSRRVLSGVSHEMHAPSYGLAHPPGGARSSGRAAGPQVPGSYSPTGVFIASTGSTMRQASST